MPSPGLHDSLGFRRSTTAALLGEKDYSFAKSANDCKVIRIIHSLMKLIRIFEIRIIRCILYAEPSPRRRRPRPTRPPRPPPSSGRRIDVDPSPADPLLPSPSSASPSGSLPPPRAMQEVGDDVILNCSSDREVHLCRWKTPYLNTYIVGEGIYVERGREGLLQITSYPLSLITSHNSRCGLPCS